MIRGTPEAAGADAFRWVIAREATLTVPMRPIARRITIHALPMTHSSLPPQTMGLAINGQTVGKVAMENGWSDYAFVAPAAVWRSGLNELTLSFANAAAPVALDPKATDPRTLAASITRITIDDPALPPRHDVRAPVFSTRFASGSLLAVRCPLRQRKSRFDPHDLDRAAVEAMIARLGLDPVSTWPLVANRRLTLEQVAEIAAFDSDCIGSSEFLEHAFEVLTMHSPNSVERRELLAQIRTGMPRIGIVSRIVSGDGFRRAVVKTP